ncbi:MAG TPA: YdcF family protein [Candidatus Hungatella pullicola]|nr:YdcF family protein [Candidatus Hungatella pullicola]
MTWFLGFLAIGCVIYYGIIVAYSGFATSFSFVWLVLAGVCFFMAAGVEIYPRHRERFPLWLPVSAVTVCLTGVVIFAVIELLIFTGAAGRDTSNLDYLIVLGARVKEDGITKSLKSRLDKAAEYAAENPDTILVLSGGQGENEPVCEAEAMKDYLVQVKGLKPGKMILETRSTSTVENIAYSKIAIEEDMMKRRQEQSAVHVHMEPGTYEEVPERPARIGVLTNDFHVFRAEQIAKKWGIPDIYGISCPSDPVLFLHFCVRESAAILKDKLVGNM